MQSPMVQAVASRQGFLHVLSRCDSDKKCIHVSFLATATVLHVDVSTRKERMILIPWSIPKNIVFY
jgi:hypothetical protein